MKQTINDYLFENVVLKNEAVKKLSGKEFELDLTFEEWDKVKENFKDGNLELHTKEELMGKLKPILEVSPTILAAMTYFDLKGTCVKIKIEGE